MLRKLLNWGCAPLISSWQDQRHNHPPMCQTEAGTPEVGISSPVFGVTLLVQQRRALKCTEQREVRSLLRGPSSPVQEPASESALSSTRWRFCAPFWSSQLKPDVRAEESAGTVQTSEVRPCLAVLFLLGQDSAAFQKVTALLPPSERGCAWCAATTTVQPVLAMGGTQGSPVLTQGWPVLLWAPLQALHSSWCSKRQGCLLLIGPQPVPPTASSATQSEWGMECFCLFSSSSLLRLPLVYLT